MKVTLGDLFNVSVEDSQRFSVASALAAMYAPKEMFNNLVCLNVSGYHTDDWERLLHKFSCWVKDVGFQAGLSAIFPVIKVETVEPELICNMFLFWWCKTCANVKDFEEQLKQSVDIPKVFRSVLEWLRGCNNTFGFIIGLAEREAKDGLDIDNSAIYSLFFSVVCHHLNAVGVAARAMSEDYEKDLASSNRKLRKIQTQYKDLETRVRSLMNKPPVIKEVKVADTEREDMLYEELMEAQRRIAFLEDKLAVYETNTSKEDYEVMEELYEEEQQDVDLSKYKIIIVGSYENKDAYPFPFIECQSDTAVLDKIPYVDYVLFDTRSNSHHTYAATKQKCKASGVKMFHINNRNKDVILSEAKRLIKACK